MALGFKFTTSKSTANLQVSNHIWNALKRKDQRKSLPTFNVSWMQIENRMKLFRHFWLRENLPVSPQSMSRVTLHFAVKYICLPLSLFLSFFLNSFLSLFLIPTSYTLSKKAKACTNYYKPFLFTPSFCLISHNGLYVFAQKHLTVPTPILFLRVHPQYIILTYSTKWGLIPYLFAACWCLPPSYDPLPTIDQ